MKSEQSSHIHHHFYPSNYTTLLLSDSWMIFQRMVEFEVGGGRWYEGMGGYKSGTPAEETCAETAAN
jgi:hypothetical protein